MRPATINTMRPCSLALALGFAGLLGCYTANFNEDSSGVYYCKADSDCRQGQACAQFRCVANLGPQVLIKEPELLTEIPANQTSLLVTYEIAGLTVSDSNERVEGQGKVLVRVDDSELSMVSTSPQGLELDLAGGLEPGAHRLWVRAVYGDGTPYANPGATAYAAFYVVEQTAEGADSPRPQVAIVSPGPQHNHVVGEDLDIAISVRNFTIVDNGEDCRLELSCDPWAEPDPDADPCEPELGCTLSTQGHAHVYLVPNYPACLEDLPFSCNGEYLLTLRPAESLGTEGSVTRAVIPADRFPTAGTFTFTASLQYNNHIPYPNIPFVVFDQVEINVVE